MLRDALLSRFHHNVLMDQEQHGFLEMFGDNNGGMMGSQMDDTDFGLHMDQVQDHLHQQQQRRGRDLFTFGSDTYDESHIFRDDSNEDQEGDDEGNDGDNDNEAERRDREAMFNNIEDLLRHTENNNHQQTASNAMDVDVPSPVVVTPCAPDIGMEHTRQHPRQKEPTKPDDMGEEEVVAVDSEQRPLTKTQYRLVLMVTLMVRHHERLQKRVLQQAEKQTEHSKKMAALPLTVDSRVLKRAARKELVQAVRQQQLRELSSDDVRRLLAHLNCGELLARVASENWSLCHASFRNYLIMTLGPSHHVIVERGELT